jgi:hypothetical protein
LGEGVGEVMMKEEHEIALRKIPEEKDRIKAIEARGSRLTIPGDFDVIALREAVDEKHRAQDMT